MEFSLLKKEIELDKENVLMSKNYEEQKKEIREDENTRIEGLKQLRNWIKQNSDLDNCIIDDGFLLRFLRIRKFSVPMSQQTLLKYLNFRQIFSHVMGNLDFTEPGTSDLIENGYIYASPFRDCNGRRVIFYDFNGINLQKHTGLDIQRADAITFETLIDEEECQIMGVTHVIHAGNIGPSIVPVFYTNKDFGYLIKWGEQSFPMRHKAFIVTSAASYIKFIYEIAKNIISSKLRARISMEQSVETLQQKLGKKCLPLELGGAIPAKEMIALFKEELIAKRERLLSIDKIKLLNNEGIMTRRNKPKQDDTGTGSLAGSFRKLEID